jgi:perosamine synthetase
MMENANVPRKDLAAFVRPCDVSLQEAMRTIDANGCGIVVFVEGEVVKGILTDGDVRRALLGGARLSDSCRTHMKTDFTVGLSSSPRAVNIGLMSRRVSQLPIVDAAGRLVDLISWKDIWRIPLASPSFDGNEMQYVQDCISSGWISSQGDYIPRFEEATKQFLGAGHAWAVTSGTMALQLAVQALDIGFGDEVIIPNFTFGASANAVMQRGARPVFVDVDPDTWTLDPNKIEAAITPQTKAIMPVHIYGQPCDMEAIMDIARRRGLRVIEDVAEALGAEAYGRKVGTWGDVGCFSFFANKIITTGEGGLVTANDPALSHRLRILRDHGMEPHRRYWHSEAGTNGRMTNLQAAIGLAQMERVSQFLSHRDQIMATYDTELAGIPGIVPHRTTNWARRVCWLYSITVNADTFGLDRDTLLKRLSAEGIECRPVFEPLDVQPAYQYKAPAPFPVSVALGNRGMSLPTGNDIPLAEVRRVAGAVRAWSRPAIPQAASAAIPT